MPPKGKPKKQGEPRGKMRSVAKKPASSKALGRRGQPAKAKVQQEPDFSSLRNLADSRYGSEILFATDEWFAVGSNLLKPSRPVFDPDAFCEQGKVMDGWESRRRRLPGHDWCIIKLGLPGLIQGIEIDTAWFTGNQTPQVRVFGIELPEDDVEWLPKRATLGVQGTCSTPEEIHMANKICESRGEWIPLVPLSKLNPGYAGKSVHRFIMDHGLDKRRITHLRLNQHPDGGIARLRAYGTVACDFDRLKAAGVIDLLAAAHGGRGLACSNKHYGEPRQLCNPGRGVNMGDGWETARNPNRPSVMEQGEDGFVKMPGVDDWCILQFGAVAKQIERLVVDTHFFRGNYPESVKVEVADLRGNTTPVQDLSAGVWQELLPRSRMSPDKEHEFSISDGSLMDKGQCTHLRLTIYPDGGVMRLRAFGEALEPLAC